jgi:hypothetical protein
MRTMSACVTTIPLGRRLPDASSNLPGRPDLDTDPKPCPACAEIASHRPYSVLLPVGFAVPPASLPARCALTAPFHPCRGKTLRTAAVCSLWHCPWARTRRMLSGTVCPWSPDFPPRQPFGFAGAAVRPTDRERHGGAGRRRQGAGSRRRIRLRSKFTTQPAASRRASAPPWSADGRAGRAIPATYCGSTDRKCRRCAQGGNGAGTR